MLYVSQMPTGKGLGFLFKALLLITLRAKPKRFINMKVLTITAIILFGLSTLAMQTYASVEQNATGSTNVAVLRPNVGLPRYILFAKHESDGFKIDAVCIDAEYKSRQQTVIQFQWGIKLPNKSIEWMTTNSASILVPLEDEDAVVFFKVSDTNGNESATQSIQVNSRDVFVATNNHLKIDAAKNIYKDDNSSYSYKYGKVYLTRDDNLPTEYQQDIWTSTKAVMFSPFANQYNVLVTRGEIPIKGILPQEELDYIISNSDVGQVNIYTIALLNPENEIIQLLPFTITLK